MKFFTVLSALLTVAPTALATTSKVTYDETYDNSSDSLDIVACSNGAHGLDSRESRNFAYEIAGI